MASFVLDEDVHRSLATLLTAAGHTVVRIQDAGLAGSTDSAVFDFAQARGAVLVTCDLGVADVRVLGREPHYGVMLLRMPNEMSTGGVDEEVRGLLG